MSDYESCKTILATDAITDTTENISVNTSNAVLDFVLYSTFLIAAKFSFTSLFVSSVVFAEGISSEYDFIIKMSPINDPSNQTLPGFYSCDPGQ